MNYSIALEKEKIYRPGIKLYTGNIGTYTFSFDFNQDWQGFIKFASFSKDNETYISEIVDNMVCVPYEILLEPGVCSFGIYGTNGKDDIKRISSNILEFEVLKGGYSDGLTPQSPTPDIWEKLFENSVPKIIDSYWHLYNPQTQTYVNAGVNAVGQFPVKGIDYFTDADKTEFVEMVKEKAIGDIEIALDEIIAIQNGLIGGEIA